MTETESGVWWEALYDDLLADVLLARDDDAAVEATVDFLMSALDLGPGSRAFDQCCGIGSLSLPLAGRGIAVVGVDQAASYVERARSRAAADDLDAELHAGDACDFVPAAACDAAFNWWTSFGYSPHDRDNARMLERAFDALRPGGRFALDTMNLPGVLRGFERNVVTRRRTTQGEVVLVRESRLDLPAGMMEKTWTYVLPDERRVVRESAVRLYMPHSLTELLRSVGFVDVDLRGSVQGEPLGLDSPRCIALARKPG